MHPHQVTLGYFMRLGRNNILHSEHTIRKDTLHLWKLLETWFTYLQVWKG